jgi:hypothetical protein
MGYKFDNTDYAKILYVKLSDNSIVNTIYLRGKIEYKAIDNNIVYENLNNELIIEHIGQRAEITIDILNNNKYNSNAMIHRFLTSINNVMNGTHIYIVYPFYNPEQDNTIQDAFECILDGYYNIKRIHETVRAGNVIMVRFIQRIPAKNFVAITPPEIPYSAIPYSQNIFIS